MKSVLILDTPIACPCQASGWYFAEVDGLPALRKGTTCPEAGNIRVASDVINERPNGVRQPLDIDTRATICWPRWHTASIRIACLSKFGPVLAQSRAEDFV